MKQSLNQVVAVQREQDNFTLKLATVSPADYVNIIIERKGVSGRSSNDTMTADTARKLRDALIEMYPLPTPAPAPVEEKRKAPRGAQAYRGNGNHDWEVVAEDTLRLRVPGGWIYSDNTNSSFVFVPMAEVVGYAI